MKTALIVAVVVILAAIGIYWYQSSSGTINISPDNLNLYGTQNPTSSPSTTVSASFQVSPKATSAY